MRGLPILYDVPKNELRCMNKAAPFKLDKGKIHLRVLTDLQSVEIYANDCRVYMPMNGHQDLDSQIPEGFQLVARGRRRNAADHSGIESVHPENQS